MTRATPAALFFTLVIALAVTAPLSSIDGRGRPSKPPKTSPTPVITYTPTITPNPTQTPSPSLTQAPTPLPTAVLTPPPSPTSSPSVYSFVDEFTGTTLSAAWRHNYTCCGTTVMDPTLSYVNGDGYLHQRVEKRPDQKWYSDIIDTRNSFVQTYGYYEARMRVVEGKGFWPAFWLYNGTFGTDGDEIDVMEICANPNGTNGGNDVTFLHQTVHKGTQSNQVWNLSGDMGGSLATDWHVYGVDWRPTYIAFYIDGVETWRESSLLISTPKAVLLNFGVGGSWCSEPDATTPTSSEVLTDWVHVKP